MSMDVGLGRRADDGPARVAVATSAEDELEGLVMRDPVCARAGDKILAVRYASGSQEYPEYVASQFNDVVAVFVNEQNCALVPSTPVASTSINRASHGQYYVDDAAGAAGYNTALDGLIVPLECRVPAQPGQPVTVRIATADASDLACDSALALLDDGIWSE